MNNVLSYFYDKIVNNSNIINNPIAQEQLNIIRNNDSVKGEQIARNICSSYGITPEEALNYIKNKTNVNP